MTPSPRVKILAVDDSPANLFAIASVLEGLDLELVTAGSGEEALRKTLRQDFAAILLDVRMGGMDGFETASLLRGRRQTSRTPILFITGTQGDDWSMVRGYSIGAVDFLTKPIQPEVLRSKVTVFADLYRKTAELAEAKAALEAKMAESQAHMRLVAVLSDCESLSSGAARMLEAVAAPLRSAWSVFWQPADAAAAEPVAAAPSAATVDATAVHDCGGADCSDGKCSAAARPQRLLCQATWPPVDAPREHAADPRPEERLGWNAACRRGPAADPSPTARAWRSKTVVVWSAEELAGDPLLAGAGFLTAASVPVASDGAEGGVFEWFFRRELAPLVDWPALSAALGQQIEQTLGRWHAERASRQARLDAEAASRAKSAFVATMSHEIRTPLNAIIGLSELLQTTTLDEVQGDYVVKLAKSSRVLLGLVNDILDFSKIEADRLELEPSTFRLRELFQNLIDVFGVQAQLKGVQLVGKVDDAVPDALVGDHVRIQQILFNLIGNAIKFTDQGEVAVLVQLEAQSPPPTAPPPAPPAPSPAPAGAEASGSAGRCMIRVRVRDSGVGVPPEQLESIFHPFTQVQGGRTRRTGGTGLGLSITRRLVEMMGGRIGVESKLCEGSEFSFTAALGVASEAPPPRPADAPGGTSARPLRVLLVEDEEINRMLATRMLKKLGHDVLTANNGRLALDAVESSAAPIDVILMDLQMPVMDGVETTRRLRAASAEWSKTPIVAMTASALAEDRDECLAAGMNAFVTKPLRSRDLEDVLQKYAAAR